MWDERLDGILRDFLPFLPVNTPLERDTDLRYFGLDSLATVELLATLEQTYDVRFADDLLTMETFATPATLWAALTRLGAGEPV